MSSGGRSGSGRILDARGELETYRKMRDFKATSEPSGRKGPRRKGDLAFVVQKHAARNLHYDFRLEWDGVLLSWAVPKGPVPDPSVKRLAMRTEDHPLSYADFEGIIPRGEYGGGTVMVWDRGRWTPRDDPEKGLKKGRLDFDLEGEKLRGRWTLVRSAEAEEKKEPWLLFKRNDEAARPGTGDLVLEEQSLSVLTGRSLEEIAEDRERIWRSGEKEGGSESRDPKAQAVDPSVAEGARRRPLPSDVGPQLATLVKHAPEGEAWLHEIKYDGYRLLCRAERDDQDDGELRVRLATRNALDWTERFPRLARAAGALPVKSAILDGEAVVMDRNGRSDFQALQQALASPGSSRILFYAFDLLHLDGWDLRRAPQIQRKALLEELLQGASSVIRYSDHVLGSGGAFHAQACELGLEGIISKRAAAGYSSGRGRSWLKVKCLRRQEMVVVGWTDPEGSRVGLGALVLGVHDEQGTLHYAGRVGTGFTDRTLREIRKRLEPLARKTPPVKGAPSGARGRRIHWVRPELVAEVAFAEWTTDGAVRHPSFQGLREDKAPVDVIREREHSTPAAAPSTRTGRTRKGVMEIAGVNLTNPDRVLYPEGRITKVDLARYWESVADVALPFLVDRPLTLYRCPRGIGGECFYQKHADTVPDIVRRIRVPEKSGESKAEPYMFLDGLPALITLVQLGVLEFHVWNARTDRLDRPDTVVMDLDPGPGVAWSDTVLAALVLRDLLSELGLKSWPRATGGKGLHVVTPITRRHGWGEVKDFARSLAELMASGAPERFLATASKAARKGKIYVDYLRNDRNATAIGTFSTRARPGAPVAHPLTWKELEGLDAAPLLSIREAAEIDWAKREPWNGYGELRQSITRPMREALGLSTPSGPNA